jgi:hypothetical protein
VGADTAIPDARLKCGEAGGKNSSGRSRLRTIPKVEYAACDTRYQFSKDELPELSVLLQTF